jgi:hypothetical protein
LRSTKTFASLRIQFCKILALLFFLVSKEALTQNVDTLLIKDLKNFFYKQTGLVLKDDLFTQWDNKPYFIKYISPSEKIDDVQKYNKLYQDNTGKDSLEKKRVYDTLYYDVPADAACKLRPEFSTYSSDGLAFVIFHELMHNYIGQKSIKVPYVFEEAICDIIGNYCTLAFAGSDRRIDTKSAKKQIEINDNIYAAINKCIAVINDHPEKRDTEHKKCEGKIHGFLAHANQFQKFRLGYKVNNAFLLKCRNYSWNYFIFKKIFLKQKSIPDFVSILNQMSENCETVRPEVNNYLLELYKNTSWDLQVAFKWDSLFTIIKDDSEFYVAIIDHDPLNLFVKTIETTDSTIEITPDICMEYWNDIVNEYWPGEKTSGINLQFTRISPVGQTWVATSAFKADGHIMCWLEEIDLQMGKKVNINLTKENVTYIEVKKSNH